MNKIIIIAGPTASGKSQLAVDIAKKLSTYVLSADSMQIYKGMDIGTAKITESEMQGVKHYIIDVVRPNNKFSVSNYMNYAKPLIETIHNQNKIPVICGGTGLYIDAILYPLTMGAKDDIVKNRLQEEYEKLGAEYMHSILNAIDPVEAQKVHANNVKRVLRALEIFELTGQTKTEQTDRTKNLNYDTLLIVLNPDRDVMYDRINKRVDKMFNDGLEDEIKRLLDSGITFDCQSMQAIGYKEFKQYFDGNITKDELIDEIKKNTRHYAKRQVTWFKRYPFAKFVDINDKEKIMNMVETFIKE